MKLSDYIVNFFVEKNIKDFFGYQGTMIAHFVDSIEKNKDASNHITYNEQGAGFAACGYAISTGRCGVAYATSGPGAINLVSAVANAFYDSLPAVFITGQVNTYEYRHDIPGIRQHSFQETNIVEMVLPVTKYAVHITDANSIRYELEKAYHIATTGRKGPVLLDIPMNIQRAEIELDNIKGYSPEYNAPECSKDDIFKTLKAELEKSACPVLLMGNGIAAENAQIFIDFAKHMQMPVVTSLLGKHLIAENDAQNFGYLGGAYGHRYANMIVAGKSDLIISIGMSLVTRQTGTKVDAFAENARLIRFDIDPVEISRKIKKDEKQFLIDSALLAKMLRENTSEWMDWTPSDSKWLDFCNEYKKFCIEFDSKLTERYSNKVIEAFNPFIKQDDIISSDIGQHMMWIGQSVHNSGKNKFLFSGAHGAMGFSLPASIGAAVANRDKTVFCFCGDGSFQMNIQELQVVATYQLDMVIIVLNNKSLGLIRQQQDAYFDSLYAGAAAPYYSTPDFKKIANAYGINAVQINSIEDVAEVLRKRTTSEPLLIEYIFDEPTFAYPKTKLGEKIYNQEPLIPQQILEDYLERGI